MKMFRILVYCIWILIQFVNAIDYKVSVLIVAEPNQDTFDELKVSVTVKDNKSHSQQFQNFQNAFVEVFGSTSYHLGNDTITAAFVDAKR